MSESNINDSNVSAVKKADLRWASEQALASARIEGHIPTPAFLVDCEAVIEGTMTLDDLRAASLARALAADRVAAISSGDNNGA